MKNSILLIVVLTLTSQAKAQSVLGKWYGIGDDNLAEMIIKNDSIALQMLDSANSGKGYERSKLKTEAIHRLNGKIIIIIRDPHSVEPSYRAMTFCNVKEKTSIELAVNAVNTSTNTTEKLIGLCKKDTAKLFGNIFFHEIYLGKLGKLKNPYLMSLVEFKSFLKKFVSDKKLFSYKEEFMKAIYEDQIITSILMEAGFNPVYRGKWLDRFLEKYLSDKEVEELWRKMLSSEN